MLREMHQSTAKSQVSNVLMSTTTSLGERRGEEMGYSKMTCAVILDGGRLRKMLKMKDIKNGGC